MKRFSSMSLVLASVAAVAAGAALTVGVEVGSAAGAAAGAAAAGTVAPQGRSYTSMVVREGGEPRPLVPGTVIRLTFTEQQVVANAGCNTLSGAVSFTADTIVVSELASTRMACALDRHAQDRWLTDFLKADPNWWFGGGALFLRTDDAEIILGEQLPAVADRPLLNRHWIVDTLLADRVVYQVPPKIHISVLFETAPDGSTHLAGILSCNWLSGTVDLDATAATVTVHGLGTTKRACEVDDPRAETYLFAALRDTSMFWFDGDQLTIAKPTGPGLTAHPAF